MTELCIVFAIGLCLGANLGVVLMCMLQLARQRTGQPTAEVER